MNELQLNEKLFEFTKQEENDISEVICELSQIICEFIANGVSGEQEKFVTVFDIIFEMIGQERASMLHFALLGVVEIDGMIKIQTNENSISRNAIEFLEGLLQNQLEYFQKNIPIAIQEMQNLHKNYIEYNPHIYEEHHKKSA